MNHSQLEIYRPQPLSFSRRDWLKKLGLTVAAICAPLGVAKALTQGNNKTYILYTSLGRTWLGRHDYPIDIKALMNCRKVQEKFANLLMDEMDKIEPAIAELVPDFKFKRFHIKISSYEVPFEMKHESYISFDYKYMRQRRIDVIITALSLLSRTVDKKNPIIK